MSYRVLACEKFNEILAEAGNAVYYFTMNPPERGKCRPYSGFHHEGIRPDGAERRSAGMSGRKRKCQQGILIIDFSWYISYIGFLPF